jgi:hypothetical protein
MKVTYKNECVCTYMRACVVCVWREGKGMTANMKLVETEEVSRIVKHKVTNNYMHESDSNMRVSDR